MPPSSQPSPIKGEGENKSFWALIVTQFFGAFNDNLFKLLVSLLIVRWVVDPSQENLLVNLGGAIFVAPFILFSMAAGRIADRVGKPKVIRFTKVWELVVVAAAVASIHVESIHWMLATLFLLSLQATFFGPAKYGVLPELLQEDKLSYANGVLNLGTFAGILLGTVAATFLATHLFWAKAFLLGASILGLGAAWFMNPLPPAKADTPMRWNPLVDFLENWRIIRADRPLKLGVLAVNYFWFMGAALQLNLVLYANQMMLLGPWPTGQLIMAVALGVGIGSYLCGKFSQGKVELGLVPLGSFLMSIFAIDLLWAHHSFGRTLFDLFMVGVGGGFYDIPLMALIQWRSPKEDRGRIQATVNLLSFVAILGATLVMGILGSVFKLNPAQVFFALGVASLIGTSIVYRYVPDALWRFLLYGLTNIFYRIRIVGQENIPLRGPGLLVSNHLSLADGFLVGGSMPRLPRFLIWRPYYDAKQWHWLLRTIKAIPVSEKDSPKEILRSLHVARKAIEEGHLVCIFAEGQISRTGNLLEFKKGFEVIVKGLDVPVIPVHLDRVWGSIFSFEHGRVIFKRPQRIPYPVTVTFGKPLRGQDVSASTVRQAVLDLGTQAFTHRLEEREPLVVEFIKRANRQPRALAIADSSGKEMSFARLAAASLVFSRLLKKILGTTERECVGILLPPSVGGVLVNVALALLGKTPVNLNYTAGIASIDHAIAQAGISRILTSRKLLQKVSLPETSAMMMVEDLVGQISKAHVIAERLLFALLPLRSLLGRYKENLPETPLSTTATIMFSSGSTGVPKGVVLSHANILSNLLSLGQVFDLSQKDRMIGVLPLFHSFGFTATMWFPLVHGFGVVYHTNPLDSRTVGELAEKYHGTLIIVTPTFLSAYTRKCLPGQFRFARYVITGAERLSESVAKAFEEKFGKIPLEGYGCTELSPVATVNVPNVSMGEIQQVGRKSGMIGHPIPGVSVKIVDPETFEPLPQNEPGLLLVKGPNVMQGYLNNPQKTAEVIRDGWYITGDIAKVDHDGFVQIVDRLSRFSKIGGEMVPHVLLEEKLQVLSGQPDPAFVVSSAPDEKRGERLVVLYTPAVADLDGIYEKLNGSGIPKLWIPSRSDFFKVESFPVLGTGKLDLQALKRLALEFTAPPAR